ncbi:MAG: DUF4430 domain-containing protein [Peptococcaceae bacterium]|nr:DUF4430 domain-containing protein [Peptococcaceae bacterium]
MGLLLAIIMMATALWAVPGAQPAQAANGPINSAVQYLYEEYTAKGLANRDTGVGSYAFYVLHQAGVDVGDWQYEGISLEEAVIDEINTDLSNPAELSAKLLAQDLAAAVVLEREDLADGLLRALEGRESSTGFDSNIYSDIPAYELLGRIGRLGVMDAGLAKECLLAAQNKTADDADCGSFGGLFDGIFYPDFMTTAQAVRALHFLDPDGVDNEVQVAIDQALYWLQARQRADGCFLDEYDYDIPIVDTAEVIITLEALGQDPASWKSSGGNSAVDYMMNEALNSDGNIGGGKDVQGPVWVICACSLLDIATPEIPISPTDYALEFLRNEYVKTGLVDNDMGVGSYTFYVLHQAGVDVGDWQYKGISLKEAVIEEINTDLSNPAELSAKLLAQDLAAAVVLEREDLAGELLRALEDRESSTGFDSNIYSDIPAYELLGRIDRLGVMDVGLAKECLLAAQNKTPDDADYGSFGGDWGPDFMTTTQAVRALHYLDPQAADDEIQQAISTGLDWLQARHRTDGCFLDEYDYDDPVTDTAEMIMTLAALDQDLYSFENSKTAVEYVMNEALNSDGSFGKYKNVPGAVWALSAYNLLDTQFYLNPLHLTLGAGRTVQFKAFWQDDGDTADVTQGAVWSVADGTIISVDDTGLVTALKEGRTRVFADYNGLTASAWVTVGSSTPGGGNDETDITVGLAVVGLGNKVLYGPSYVSVDKSNKWGLTALGALEASGIDYQTNSWSYGDFVFCIEGQANSGLSGWMYTVNDAIPGGGADKYNISDKDKIIFYYSESMDQQPPRWDELGQQSPTDLLMDERPEPVKDADLQAAIKNARDIGRVTLTADSSSTALALSSEQVARIYNTGFPLAVTIQGAQFILSPDSLKIKELATDQSTMLEFSAQKLSSEEATVLTDLFPAWLKLTGDIYELTIQTLDRDDTLQDISLFPDCQVCLPIPTDIEAEAAGLLKAFWYNEDSRQWVNMGGIYNAEEGLFSFSVDHFSKYTLLEVVQPPEEEIIFLDTLGHWARGEIAYMATAGYVVGVGERLFAPDAQITRAEFTAILARMAGLLPNPVAAACFNDVPVDAWYRGAVGAAAAEGLVYGSDENSFAPDALVTREQMAAILVRFMAKNGHDLSGDAGAGSIDLHPAFSDSGEISPWAQLPVAQAVDSELLVGREKDMFAPQGSATRAEATVVLYRALQKLP